MKKLLVITALAMLVMAAYAQTASAIMPPKRPTPPVIIVPPVTSPQPIQSAM